MSVGRGAVSGSELPLVRRLVDLLRVYLDADVELAASRPVVESGIVERERQVGQTGKSVRPDLYIALGISGAVQHLAGMRESAWIMAVNSDPEAPIRRVSDLFVVGTVQEFVRTMVQTLEASA